MVRLRLSTLHPSSVSEERDRLAEAADAELNLTTAPLDPPDLPVLLVPLETMVKMDSQARTVTPVSPLLPLPLRPDASSARLADPDLPVPLEEPEAPDPTDTPELPELEEDRDLLDSLDPQETLDAPEAPVTTDSLELLEHLAAVDTESLELPDVVDPPEEPDPMETVEHPEVLELPDPLDPKDLLEAMERLDPMVTLDPRVMLLLPVEMEDTAPAPLAMVPLQPSLLVHPLRSPITIPDTMERRRDTEDACAPDTTLPESSKQCERYQSIKDYASITEPSGQQHTVNL